MPICFRQIALKALSERLSKSHVSHDKRPLLPTTSHKAPVPIPPHEIITTVGTTAVTQTTTPAVPTTSPPPT